MQSNCQVVTIVTPTPLSNIFMAILANKCTFYTLLPLPSVDPQCGENSIISTYKNGEISPLVAPPFPRRLYTSSNIYELLLSCMPANLLSETSMP